MIEFKYRHYINFGKKGELIVIYRPNAIITITNRDISRTYDMLIDSGADTSLIPKEMGEKLNLEIVSEEEIETIKGIGGEIPVVYKNLLLTIGEYTIKAKVGWAMVEGIPPILGREDIFDTFHIEFLQDKKITRFHKLK